MAEAISQADEVCASLAKMANSIAAALPPHITPEKFVRVAQTAVRQNPDLIQADRASLYGAVLQAAADGLLPDGVEAMIAVYNTNHGTKESPKWVKEASYSPMVAGIMKKVRNSGELAAIDAQVVCEKDEYEAWVDEKGPHFKFRKAKGDRGKEVITFAYAILRSGSVYFEEMSEQDTDAIENMSKSKAIWKGPFRSEMKRKSALRRLCKRLPMSTDIEGVVHADDKLYDLNKARGNGEGNGSTPRLDSVLDRPSVPSEVSPL